MLLKLKRGVTEGILLLLVFNVILPGLTALAETPEETVEQLTTTEKSDTAELPTEQLQYSKLMRDVRENTAGTDDLTRFISEEQVRLENLGVDKEKQTRYFELLDTQLENITSRARETTSPIIEFFDAIPIKNLKTKTLEKPSQFQFENEEVIIKSLKIPTDKLSALDKIGAFAKSIFGIKTAYAIDTQYMPVIEDIQPDGEVIISGAIRDLARELNNNPVEIVNYIQNNIDYEPYFGAKKGSVGCLNERLCNDVDTASLTIALMRAAGIPARYKKGLAVMTVHSLQNLLGVDETKTVYYALYTNNIPVYTVSGTQVGRDIDTADFSQETHLAVEWVYPEIFYDYDERGANIPNTMDLSGVQTTGDLQALFLDSPKKQWIPVDTTVKTYDRTQNEIVHDTTNFNTEDFWYDFLQYQGDLSPIAKYTQDLQTQTGKDITQAQYQSMKEIAPHQFDILPYRLPYAFMSGVDGDGYDIDIETWSSLPDDRRYQVTISLLRESDNSDVFSHTFFGSEINNQPVDLVYEGATETDEAVIESYGGIHATPAALVDIRPYFLTDTGKYEAQNSVSIGDSLIMQFEYIVNGESIHTDQKFSTAGNQEGIYMALSKVLDNPYFTDGLNDNSEILLEGNTGLAWKYLREVEEDMNLLSKSLDYEYDFEFFRAVVTQNRILSEVSGVPTTFDFKGLTMDASSYVSDYSNRGNFKDHQDDFRFLWSEEASYYEGQLFTDVAGLEGISTVKGLQYAYANPQTYTIHTITSSNESVIDTLSLSSNTKSNMHADVQEGNTIITPDKPVMYGTFAGTLYISLDPEKTGTYAIGEQVANGGWTISDFQYASYFPPMGIIVEYLLYSDDEKQVCFEDSMYGNPDLCMASWAEHNETEANNPGYQDQYGCLCDRGSKEYGDKTLTYVLALGGAKFYMSDGSYGAAGYWVWDENVRTLINTYIENNNLDGYDLSDFKFSTLIGTYFNRAKKFTEALYYSPLSNQVGEVYRVFGNIFEKLKQNNNEVVQILGFPTSYVSYTSPSNMIPGNTQGLVQSFVDGKVYEYDMYYLTWTHYIYGELENKHEEMGGTAGVLGYPMNDPEKGYLGNVYQRFEEDENGKDQQLKWDGLPNGLVYLNEYQKYQCELWLFAGEYIPGGDLILSTFAFINGFIDSGVATFDDLYALYRTIDKILTLDLSPIDILRIITDVSLTAMDIYMVVKDLDYEKVANKFSDITNSTIEAIKNEINEGMENSMCSARLGYLWGRLIGEIALIIVPSSKIVAAAKIKLISKGQKVIKGLKTVSKTGYWGRKMKILNQADIEEWNVIKGLPQAEKGQAGEDFWKRFVDGDAERKVFPVDNPDLGDRISDIYEPKTGIGYEVKNYGSANISLSDVGCSGFSQGIISPDCQILKDIWLMNDKVSNYKPVWVFADKGPTSTLRQVLEKNGIEIIELTN
ncbi:MAG: transglutaminase-like domain-containing protein [Candidatus Peregrinibacteria bacterium]